MLVGDHYQLPPLVQNQEARCVCESERGSWGREEGRREGGKREGGRGEREGGREGREWIQEHPLHLKRRDYNNSDNDIPPLPPTGTGGCQ